MRSEMSTEEREEWIILALLEGEDATELAARAESEEERRLVREYAEVMGLLSHALDPVEPRPQVQQRLMAAVAGAAGGTPSAGKTPSDAGALADGGGAVAPFMSPAPRSTAGRGWGAWPQTLAAGLALLMLGLSLFLYLRLERAQQQVSRLSAELARVSQGERESAARLARLEREVAAASSKLAMVTQAGAEACPLRPVGGDPPHPRARGVLFIAADHQHWFLKVTGLEPAPEERTYQLWFITDAGPVSAGTFRTGATAEAEIGSPSMPSGITAVAVTVEPAAGARQPSGPPVLYGAEKMTLL